MESFIGAFLGVCACELIRSTATYFKIRRQVYKISNKNEKRLEEMFERC